ncbi:MAG TPA: UvrD-helicase domain-containing protein, partial [Anaerolineae bacterium]|nr:UvrD-helicase domain-containing protein [Anaerolineae bacterium]
MPHPIVLQMSPSPEQEPAITARGRDIVVTAGAGTGKTRTLVARYLSLLAEGLPLRSIVAITFTRKAAREMRNRVRDEMRRYLEQPGLTAAERQRWQGLYAELDAARIGTIHSLCTEVLRAHPAEAEVDPSFQVTDEPSSSMLHKQALEEAMAWAADKDDIVPLFGLLGERRLRQVLERILQKRLDVDEAFADAHRDWLQHWKKALGEHQDRVVARLQAEPLWLDAVATLRENSATRPNDRIACQCRDVLSALESLAKTPEPSHDILSCLGEIKLNCGSAQAWSGGQQQLRRVKGALGALRDLWKRAGLADKVTTPLDEELAQAMPALRTLFQHACHTYDALKRNQDALDFDDLEQQALALLQRDASVRARWQSEARAVLVDEFQDTNGRQRDLVALLNGNENKLFIVGDAKQSIYRFRGADVTVFRAERNRIEREGGWVFSLNTSYRAHRPLVQGLNDLLRPVLGEQPDPDRPWAEPFAELKHARTEPASGCEAPYIEMILTTGAKSDGALDRAACAVSNHIVELSTKGVGYGDVAILCRASTSFQAYEEALHEAGVPFVTIAGRGFYHRPEIRDLLNALRAVADPTDDLALVGLLRSPAFAFPDSAIYHLCKDRGRKGKTPLWDGLRERGQQLLTEEGCDVQRFVDSVSHLHRLVSRTRIADVLKAFLDRTDYRAALIQAG